MTAAAEDGAVVHADSFAPPAGAEGARRAVGLDPRDPSLPASLRDMVAYAGEWEQGEARVREAPELEPTRFQKG